MKSAQKIMDRLQGVRMALVQERKNGASLIANPTVEARLDSAERTLCWVLDITVEGEVG